MGKVTWLGEGEGGPQETTWANQRFEIGKAVEIDDETLLRRASGNRFFKVEGYDAKAGAADPLTYVPPSQQSAQGPVPKPGEPIRSFTREESPPKPQVDPESESETEVARKPLRKV